MGLIKKAKTEATKGNNKKQATRRVPKNVMESIPYRSIYPNGIIEDLDGRFSKSYRLRDANFDTEEEEKQEHQILAYEKLLNSIDEEAIGQLTIINRSVDQDVVRNNILMKPKSDDLNDLRNEWNNLFLEQISSSRNNLSKDKLFTISVKAGNILEADDIFKRTDRLVSNRIRKITHQDTPSLTIEERLDVLYDVYNCKNTFPFSKRIEPIVKPGTTSIDWKTLAAHGMSSKELIAPDAMDFYANYFCLGDDCFAKTFYIDRLPVQLSTSFLNDISNLACNMITSITFIQMNQEKARALINDRMLGMNAQINRQQSSAIKDGISNAGVVSAELENARDEASNLLSDVMKRDQKIFKVTGLVTIFAQSREELGKYAASLKSIVNGHLCQLRSMNNQMEQAFNTTLPLAQMQLEDVDRILTTEAASVYMPFNVQDMNQMDGTYYGVNPLSENMIRYNRKKGSNYNALILGASGSGKSFLVKEEISQRFLNSDDNIIIIDPEGEYVKMGRKYGATIIDISLDGKTHLNPLDMDMQYGGAGENPVPMKCDFIESLIESMVGGADMLSPIDKSIIQRVGRNIYVGYCSHMKTMIQSGITCDYAAMPTLQDFYSEMIKQNEPQAQYLATAIESYCVGNLALFAERTNIDTDNRMIIYNIQGMGSVGMQELAMHVCCSDAWNHMIRNGKRGKYTALYIDEFHLFTKTKSSATFMKNIYKQARKWKGMPTAISQNITDLNVNEEVTAIINNCSFIILMNQQPADRLKLQAMYSISDQLLEYITDQPIGTGLIYNGNVMIPMENEFPTDTEMFKLMESEIKKDEDFAEVS